MNMSLSKILTFHPEEGIEKCLPCVGWTWAVETGLSKSKSRIGQLAYGPMSVEHNPAHRVQLEQFVVSAGVVDEAGRAGHAGRQPLDDELELRVARTLGAAAPVARGHGAHAAAARTVPTQRRLQLRHELTGQAVLVLGELQAHAPGDVRELEVALLAAVRRPERPPGQQGGLPRLRLVLVAELHAGERVAERPLEQPAGELGHGHVAPVHAALHLGGPGRRPLVLHQVGELLVRVLQV